jgi:hypothetical protein
VSAYFHLVQAEPLSDPRPFSFSPFITLVLTSRDGYAFL